MTDATYSDTTQKCNKQSADHENVTDDSGALAEYLESYSAWLRRSVDAGVFSDSSRPHAGAAATHLMAAANIIRNSDKGGV